MTFITSQRFWSVFFIVGILFTLLFSWELDFFAAILPSPPRPEPTQTEIITSILIAVLIALDAGLLSWRIKYGTCPIGVKRAIGSAGTLGAIALLCPICLAVPFTIFGLSISLALLTPFVPLLRAIALILLVGTTLLLWPKKN